MNFYCERHGNIQPRNIEGISPHCGLCSDVHKLSSEARYRYAILRAKSKNPKWEPLCAVVTPSKMVHPSTGIILDNHIKSGGKIEDFLSNN